MVKNFKGFSLFEVMIAVGIAGLTTFAVIEGARQIGFVTSSQQTTVNADALAGLIGQHLRFQNTCQTTVRNGVAIIPYDDAQALSAQGMPIAITVAGLRAGAAYNLDQITGANNSVSTGAVPTFTGATSEMPVMGLKVNRIAFRKLAESSSGLQHYGYIYLDLEKDNTGGKISLGGNALPRKFLGGVVFVSNAAETQIVDCFGNSATMDLATVCTNLGCTFNGSTCDCPRGDFTCPPGGYLTEIRNGIPTCKNLGAGECPPGQYLKGIGLNSIVCEGVPDEVIAMAPAPAPPAPGPLPLPPPAPGPLPLPPPPPPPLCVIGGDGYRSEMGSGGPMGGPPNCASTGATQVGSACTLGQCPSGYICMVAGLGGSPSNAWDCMPCPAGTSHAGTGAPFMTQRYNSSWMLVPAATACRAP